MSADRRGPPGIDPPYLSPTYRSTVLRAPIRPPVRVPYGPTELSGPDPAALLLGAGLRRQEADLTRHGASEPQGERIIVYGG